MVSLWYWHIWLISSSSSWRLWRAQYCRCSMVMMLTAAVATWSSFPFIRSGTMEGQFILLRQVISMVLPDSLRVCFSQFQLKRVLCLTSVLFVHLRNTELRVLVLRQTLNHWVVCSGWVLNCWVVCSGVVCSVSRDLSRLICSSSGFLIAAI